MLMAESSQSTNVSSLFGLGPKELIAVVGGGGKTSLMFSLAEELISSGRQVITTTTTKVRLSEAALAPCEVFTGIESGWRENLRKGILRHGHVFVAHKVLDSGKVKGIGPEVADDLYGKAFAEYLLLEADGAAGRPLKAPAEHEPVVPVSTTLVIGMIGLEALGQPLDEKFVFRPGLFEKLTGLYRGEPLNPDSLASLFQSPNGLFKGAPLSARRIAFLNKLDIRDNRQEALDLAGRILRLKDAPVERVVVGSIKKREYLLIKQEDEGNISKDY